MARYDIYSKTTGTVIAHGYPKYTGVNNTILSLAFDSIQSPFLIDFQVGDYVDYRGMRYELFDHSYQVEKRCEQGNSGDAIVYSNVVFYPKCKVFETVQFRDLLNDNIGMYSSLSKVDTYESLYGMKDRIQANLDDIYPGEWTVKLAEPGTSHEEYSSIIALYSSMVHYTIDNGYIIDALKAANEAWKYKNVGVGWRYSYDSQNAKNILTLGDFSWDQQYRTPLYRYGKGNGIRLIKRSISQHSDICTRLYVYGSTKNLPSRYYNRKDIYNAGSIYLPNLMLPINAIQSAGWSGWGKTGNKPDAKKCHIDAGSSITDIYGIRAKSIYFDASSEEGEVYPTISGKTIGTLRSVLQSSDPYYPTTTNYPSPNTQIDAIRTSVMPDDTGEVTDDNGKVFLSHAESENIETGTISGHSKLVRERSFEFTPQSGLLQKGSTWSIRCYNPILQVGSTEYVKKVYLMILQHNGSAAGTLKKIELIPTGTSYYIDKATASVVLPYSINNISITIQVMMVDNEHSTSYTCPATTLYWDTYTNQALQSFRITLNEIGFDIVSHLIEGDDEVTLSMKDGLCGGRDFPVTKVERGDNQTWILTCNRVLDESINTYFPNSNSTISAGDHFVLVNIAMPEVYVSMAESVLLAKGQAMLDYLNREQYSYSVEVDSIQMQRWLDEEEGRVLEAGMYLYFLDSDVGDNRTLYLINSVTIDESGVIPSYSISLADEADVRAYISKMKALDKEIYNIQETAVSGKQVQSMINIAMQKVSPSEGGGEGVSNHNDLTGRDSNDQHPIGAITNLQTTLNGKASQTDMNNVKVVIPSGTTTSNKLVNSSIMQEAIESVEARGLSYNAQGAAFPTKAALNSAQVFYYGSAQVTPTNNDVVYVLEDETHDNGCTKYAYQNNVWTFRILVNESPMTQTQLDAINSGITSDILEELEAKPDMDDIPTTLAELSGDSTHRLVTDEEKDKWNNHVEDSDIHVTATLKAGWNATKTTVDAATPNATPNTLAKRDTNADIKFHDVQAHGVAVSGVATPDVSDSGMGCRRYSTKVTKNTLTNYFSIQHNLNLANPHFVSVVVYKIEAEDTGKYNLRQIDVSSYYIVAYKGDSGKNSLAIYGVQSWDNGDYIINVTATI